MGKHAASSWMRCVSAFDGREKKKKNRMNEWVTPSLVDVYFFFFFSLSYVSLILLFSLYLCSACVRFAFLFSSSCVFSCIETDVRICQFSFSSLSFLLFFTCWVRMNDARIIWKRMQMLLFSSTLSFQQLFTLKTAEESSSSFFL